MNYIPDKIRNIDMPKFLAKHRALWSKRDFTISVIFGFLTFIASLVANFFSGTYASSRASSSVTDLILSNLPVVNLDFIFVEGFAIFAILVTLICLLEPKRIPFVLKTVALFIFIRAIAVSLTHIGPFPTQAPIDESRIVDWFNFTGDLFFSGHTGLPFLMTLIFWREKILRYFFLTVSILFACAVLLGHWHYSIDVFAAYFITHTIFHISKIFFKKDFQRLNETPT